MNLKKMKIGEKILIQADKKVTIVFDGDAMANLVSTPNGLRANWTNVGGDKYEATISETAFKEFLTEWHLILKNKKIIDNDKEDKFYGEQWGYIK
jgi:hypothetical protein